MSAPDLAELRRIAGLTPSEICGIDRVRVLDALPYLLAKVEAAERLALPPVEQAVTPPPDVPAAAGLDARQLLPVLIGGIVLEIGLVAGLLLWWRRGQRR